MTNITFSLVMLMLAMMSYINRKHLSSRKFNEEVILQTATLCVNIINKLLLSEEFYMTSVEKANQIFVK